MTIIPAPYPPPRRRRRNERGADIVEASLALPILLTIVFALFWLGRGWDVYQTMTRAAREGVRQAVTTNCATCGDTYNSYATVQNVVYTALQTTGINTSQLLNYQQGYTWLDSSQSVCVAYVSFQYPFQVRIPFTPVPLTSVTLSTHVQMAPENQDPGGTCP